MNFSMSQEMIDWQRRVKELVHTQLMPHDDSIERTGVIPVSAVESLRAAGMFGLNTPVRFGGAGRSMLATCLAFQELAKAHIAYYYLTGVNVHIGSKAIEFHGTPEQQQRWLPELASGRTVAAFALTEPEAGSDAAGITMTARRDAEGYVLNGRKTFITNAPTAGVFTVFAKTDAQGGRAGISAFLVEPGIAGFGIGRPIEMLGGNGSGHAELIFEECRIPAGNLIGSEGEGFAIAMRCLDAGRVSWSAYSVGAAERLLAIAVQHLSTRRQFGRPLIANQGLEWQIAELYASIHSARLVSREAAWLYDQPGANRTTNSALAKLVGGEMVFKVADTVLQMLGGLGYSRNSPVERIWREVRVVRILEGTTEIMRKIVARHAAQSLDTRPQGAETHA
jgi:alkylation response protein AidB-like acyl-CoA dehydrogenase